jgi:hypothetical protein
MLFRPREKKVAVACALLLVLLLGAGRADDAIDFDEEGYEVPKSDDPIVAEVQRDAESEAMLEKVKMACAQACSVTEQSRRLKDAVSARDQCEGRVSEVLQTIDIMEKVNSNSEHQIESLKEQLAEESENHETLRETYSDLERRYSNQETAATMAAERLEVLEPEHLALKADAQQLRGALGLATSKLQGENERNTALTEENEKLKAELNALKTKSNEQRLKESLIANFSDTLEQIRGKLTTQIDQMNRTQELFEQDQKRKEAEEVQRREGVAKMERAEEEESKQAEKDRAASSTSSNGHQGGHSTSSQQRGEPVVEQGALGALLGWASNNVMSTIFTVVAVYFVFSRFGDVMFHKFYMFMNPKTIQNRGDYTKFEASTPSALFPPATPGSRRAIRNFRRTPIHVNEDRAKRMVR